MSPSHRRRFAALAIAALLLATLACNALTDAISQNPTVATAQAVATGAAEVGELLGTAQAVATDANLDDVAATAQAIATDANLDDVAATAQAMATQAFGGLGTPPPDIPLVEGETKDVFAMEGILSYSTSLSFAEVVAYYKKAMPDNGWEFQKDASLEMGELAVLNFTRADRDAVVSISVNPTDKRTLVSIVVTQK
ncbi:MAG: hypothetical protein RMK99_07820 [Anaerolineales bacterium]|nr:hypothetical protein [Anaerolineales bacterium]